MTRTVNQDSATSRTFEHGGETWTLLVVADGLGGGVDGDIASDMTARFMADDIAAEGWTDPAAALSNSVIRANTAIFERGLGAPLGPQQMMGSTVVAALIHHPSARYWTLNVGDSRGYIISRNGIRQLTADHSIVAERVRRGEITPVEARTAKDRNVVTRAVGTETGIEIDVEVRPPLEPGETLLLCSDGLHGMLADAEIAAVAARESLEMLPAMLIRAANEAGGLDNIAVAVAARPNDNLPGAVAAKPAATRPAKNPRSRRDEPKSGHSLLAIAAVALVMLAAALVAVGRIVSDNDSSSGPRPTKSPTVTIEGS
jgi:protein phosphatase